MDYQAKGSSPSTIKAVDIIVLLLKRKWLILIFTLIGVGAAAYVYFGAAPEYKSEARLLIRYVLEKRLPTGEGVGTSTRQPGGDNILASEIEVLTSYDLALEVAEKVGPAKILANSKGAPDKQAAAMLINRGVRIDIPKQSDVLSITFQHSDPSVVQPVLTQLITSYLRKHDEIHRASGLFDEVLTEQTTALRAQVAQTEEDLRKLQVRTGISNLEETKKTLTQELSRIRQEINNTAAEMAERQAALASLVKTTPASAQVSTNEVPVTNAPPISPQISNQYKAILTRVESLRKREQELTRQFTAENAMVKDIVSQREVAEGQQAEMEKEHPELIASVPVPGTTSPRETRTAFDPIYEQSRLAALQAKGATLEQMLQKIVSDMAKVQEAEPELLRLQRKREMEDAQYRQFQASLEQARFEENLGAGRLSNIGVAQTPSPPVRESRKTMKLTGMSLAGGIAVGLLLAFVFEFFVHPTIKTAGELERRTHAQVLLSIPELRNGKARKRLAAGKKPAEAEAETQVAPWDPGNHLQPYYEGLRDRIMTWFDARNLTRKPKLVAVTSCEHGAGASSIAAGLAAMFSETGDGRVLLVDMNVGQGAAHSFYKGRPGCGLDEALQEGEKRDEAQVSDNLFVVAEGTTHADRLPSVLPRRFTSLVPKLKASDFDYIIFDMPPVSPITITPRLSAYMDLVLLVAQEGRTSPHGVKQATELLGQSKANVAAVFNKTRSHGPEWLLQAAT